MSSIPGKVRIAFLGALVPAGLLVPACSASAQTLLVSALCATITNSELNRVTPTVAMAGEPSDFSTTAGLSPQRGR